MVLTYRIYFYVTSSVETIHFNYFTLNTYFKYDFLSDVHRPPE